MSNGSAGKCHKYSKAIDKNRQQKTSAIWEYQLCPSLWDAAKFSFVQIAPSVTVVLIYLSAKHTLYDSACGHPSFQIVTSLPWCLFAL
jgi:hypothetical protein